MIGSDIVQPLERDFFCYTIFMAKIITGITVSLDGFINDSNGDVGKLYPDFKEWHDVSSFKEMIKNTGAAIMGRNVYDGMADPFLWANDDYEFQVPIFVLTHTPPEKFPPGNGKLSFTFVTDGIESAISQAKKAAGDKDVQVIGGAETTQEILNSGLADILQLDIINVLVGNGLRLLENLDTDKIKLERTKVEETTSMRTSITFKVMDTTKSSI
jgi:dihydrofolate reductase